MLIAYNRTRLRQVLSYSVRLGANSLRLNAFVKGLGLQFDEGSRLIGVQPTVLNALRDAADLALEHGILLQVVLSTAHFLRFGWGGAAKVVRGSTNQQRVQRNQQLFLNPVRFAQVVLVQIAAALGKHPAVVGFLLVNEGYAMVRKEDKPLSDVTDASLPLQSLQAFINTAASALKQILPGTLRECKLISKRQTKDPPGSTTLAWLMMTCFEPTSHTSLSHSRPQSPKL